MLLLLAVARAWAERSGRPYSGGVWGVRAELRKRHALGGAKVLHVGERGGLSVIRAGVWGIVECREGTMYFDPHGARAQPSNGVNGLAEGSIGGK